LAGFSDLSEVVDWVRKLAESFKLLETLRQTRRFSRAHSTIITQQ